MFGLNVKGWCIAGEERERKRSECVLSEKKKREIKRRRIIERIKWKIF